MQGGELLRAEPTALGIAKLCDLEDEQLSIRSNLGTTTEGSDAFSAAAGLWATRLTRRVALERLLQRDRPAYLETVAFLGARLPRGSLPNRQGFTVRAADGATALAHAAPFDEAQLVADCALTNVTAAPSPLDVVLLALFRSKVQAETGGKSPTPGLAGLLDEGRTYMLKPGITPADQQQMVVNTLGWLMTPLLPPFYRLFMSGLVPSLARGDPAWLVDGVQALAAKLPRDGEGAQRLPPGQQIGPWFYAPALTAVVTPTAFGFLVGPSAVNRRQDGRLGGLVVEKCAFLQESGCKGMCLNICKLPAQAFFADTLGLPLAVSPNFETQECQWSFGETPAPPEADPAWPQGCLVGCPTRAEVRARKLELACE